MMKENKFDELNTILGATHMTIVSIVNMAIRKKIDLTEEERTNVRKWGDEVCHALNTLRDVLKGVDQRALVERWLGGVKTNTGE